MKQRKQRRDKIARLISWGHWFTFFNILLVLAIGTLYIEAAEPPGSALGVIYMLISWLGHFAFLPFVVFIILIFPFCLIVPYSRVLRGIATLVASIGLIALVADALFFRQYGYHLNTYSLSQLAIDAETVFAGASFLILIGMLLIFVVLLIFELALANIAWKRLDKLQEKHWGAAFSSVFVLCFLASHSIHVWADAVVYTPITKQDDLFPVSYPTTAKTLMSKHGLLVDQRTEAAGRLLRETTHVNLNYPAAPLMCARVPQAPTTLIVAFSSLNAAEQDQLNALFPELEQFQGPVLGQLDTQSGVFELVYGLPDLYMTAIAEQNKEPAYFAPLQDYQIELVAEIAGTAAGLPDAIADFQRFDITSPSAYIGLSLRDSVDVTAMAQIRRALQDGYQVVITALSPVPSAHPAYSVEAMQVPLWTSSSLTLQEQPLTLLTDIIPTVLSQYISCADGTSNYSVGIDLTNKQRQLPLMTSYGRDLVIYEETRTTIIDSNAAIRVFSNEDHAELTGAVPATPVLVDGLRKLKRFSQANGE